MSEQLDPGLAWDRALRESRQRLAAGKSESPKLKKLWLATEPNCTALPSKPREISLIEDGLRDTLRQLVNGEADWPLFAWGSPGCGKTCAALVLLDFAGGIYLTVPELSSKVNAAMQGKLTTIGENGCAYDCSVADFWAKIESANLVVLDEVGLRENVSDPEFEKVKTLLDIRECRPLICLSNLDPGKIGDVYDERILDRLTCGTPYECAGASAR